MPWNIDLSHLKAIGGRGGPPVHHAGYDLGKEIADRNRTAVAF
jgi:hypothetical protein